LRQTFVSRPSSEEERRGLRNEYDNRILQVDDQLRRAWSILRTKGYLEDAVVALVADHGQALGEQGQWGHLRDVTEVLMRVPVTFWSDRPMRIPADRLTSLIDVGPTLLAEAGVPLLSTWDGWPLQPDTPIRRVVAVVDIMFEPKWAGVIWDSPAGTYKYTRLSRDGGVPEKEHLFQLDDDPSERVDRLSLVSPDLLRSIRQIAADYLGD
jgi:arylsulfatase A-like enzyme